MTAATVVTITTAARDQPVVSETVLYATTQPDRAVRIANSSLLTYFAVRARESVISRKHVPVIPAFVQQTDMSLMDKPAVMIHSAPAANVRIATSNVKGRWTSTAPVYLATTTHVP